MRLSISSNCIIQLFLLLSPVFLFLFFTYNYKRYFLCKSPQILKSPHISSPIHQNHLFLHIPRKKSIFKSTSETLVNLRVLPPNEAKFSSPPPTFFSSHIIITMLQNPYFFSFLSLFLYPLPPPSSHLHPIRPFIQPPVSPILPPSPLFSIKKRRLVRSR